MAKSVFLQLEEKANEVRKELQADVQAERERLLVEVQAMSSNLSHIQTDLYNHQQDDKEKFQAILDKLDGMRNDYDYIIVGIKIIGFIGVAAYLAVKAFWFRIVDR